MKQLAQKLKDGHIQILDVPSPVLGPKQLLVRNHFSLISAGTEGSTVSAARKSLIGKAKERPQQVKQVFDTLRQQGPMQTYRAVMKKLDAYSPLGYSSAGEVIAVGEAITGFAVGDKVACAGAGYANHADVVAVPVNLCVKLDPEADLEAAAYNTLGAIALQGVRQADLRVGESCAVIGLGLLGQLTVQLLKASGVKVIGLDINRAVIDLALGQGMDSGYAMDEPGLSEKVSADTGGIGADAVIITAATDSTQPIDLAGKLLRKKGVVVVVGAVPTGFSRDAYYRKELELRMSCSYGPGRYDPQYEEKGQDYPVGYVRWTEQRNMAAFQDLLHGGRIDIAYLTTHRFKLAEAAKAYDMILSHSEPFLGVMLAYDVDHANEIDAKIQIGAPKPVGRVGIGFLGAGSYAMGNLLPNIPTGRNVALKGVLTASGTSARSVAERYGFDFCSSRLEDIIGAADINTLFIASRHDSHAAYVRAGLEAGKHVFVEKPLALRADELEAIDEAYRARLQTAAPALLMVGYNRRFSPHTQAIVKALGRGRMAMLYRINAGAIPADSWIQDKEIGGGRILGEVCHFVDLLTYLNGSLPKTVSAAAMDDPAGLNDTLTVSLHFANGSVGTIAYYANGNKALDKEYLEVYKDGSLAVLRDFREHEIVGTKRGKKSLSQDKGQKEMVKSFIESVAKGKASPIAYDELIAVSRATLAIETAIRGHRTVEL